MILTTFVKKHPAELENALLLLRRLKNEADVDLAEDALNYAIFLVDVNKLYDTALGMYDFELALMVAQKSQKDPKEYLGFMSELKNMECYYQRFKIDDHLKRHEKALENLSQAGKIHDESLSIILGKFVYDCCGCFFNIREQAF